MFDSKDSKKTGILQDIATTAGISSYESKTMCGICGTVLIDNPNCATATASPMWCPKCQCYPSSVSIGIGFSPALTGALFAIPQDEYSRLKEFEREIKQYQNQQAIHEELIVEHTKTIHTQISQIEQLKSQNKLMFEALMCLPGAMGFTVTQEVCKICVNGCKCSGCVIDEAIREAMGG